MSGIQLFFESVERAPSHATIVIFFLFLLIILKSLLLFFDSGPAAKTIDFKLFIFISRIVLLKPNLFSFSKIGHYF